jgi:glyoxylase-like metal-dependent hydrolase (beta-lactamase superfamily II)
MVSNAYFLENGQEVILFDPSCGKPIARLIEAHVQRRREARARWKKGYLVAGHSHMDHAGNLFLADVLGADEAQVYVHERGFQNGRLMNEPRTFIERVTGESRDYYNPYLALSFPYRLFMLPVAAVDVISRRLALKAFAAMAAIPWPRPLNGSVQPEPLKDEDLQPAEIGGVELSAWRLGGVFVLPTPGHSLCSVSLLWPEKKALFVSDADWLGNPVFVSGSLRDSASSLRTLQRVTEAVGVDLLCPAHGEVKEGTEQILRHFDFRIRRLEVIRDDILSAYRESGGEKDIRTLAKLLIRSSPLFKAIRLLDYPKLVGLVHNVIAVCLKEEGILD